MDFWSRIGLVAALQDSWKENQQLCTIAIRQIMILILEGLSVGDWSERREHMPIGFRRDRVSLNGMLCWRVFETLC